MTGSRCAIGVDVGGHGVKGALVGSDGGLIAVEEIPLDGPAGRSVAAVEDRIEAVVNALRRQSAGACSIGVGMPGFFDRDGTLRASPNLPDWNGTQVARRLEQRLGAPVVAENDANCAVLGEAFAGAAVGAKDVLLVTLGTGVGTGILCGGRLLRGHRGAGGEGGHILLYPGGRPCGCGQRGCLESYASGPALVEDARAAWGRQRQDPCPVGDARQVFDAAKFAEAEWAQQAVDRWVGDLALGLASLIHVLSPEVLVVGGGVARAWPRFGPPLVEQIELMTVPAVRGDLRIEPARLGPPAGAVGAAALAAGFGA